jgi:CRP-like cAMP-binding protein
LLPSGTEVGGDSLAHERDLADGRLFRTLRSGIVQASADDGAWAVFVRVAPEAYVGLAQYRHLEDDPDE